MLDAPGLGTPEQAESRNDRYRAIIRDLVSLIAHVQASVRLIESAIATELAPDDPEPTTDIIILDDVTPCYTQANAALNACRANLGVALDVLRDSRTPEYETARLREMMADRFN
jgi:hypothetical protein